MKIKNKNHRLGIFLRYSLLLVTILLTSFSSCKKDSRPQITPVPNNSSGFNDLAAAGSVIFTATKPISLNGVSNLTIVGDSINCFNSTMAGISLSNCNNIHITRSKIYNSKADGIYLYQCTNITIDTCYITNVQTGVNAVNSTGIVVNLNQMKNMVGPMPGGQFVQFNNVNGAGSKITNNKLENITGESNPEDGISIYESNGTASSYIAVSNNWIRGGGPSQSGSGIMLGDAGGSYIAAENNLLVNTGSVGIGIGAGNHIEVVNNKIYAAANKFTNVGLYVWNEYTADQNAGVVAGCSIIAVSGNQVNWTNSTGQLNNNWNAGNCGAVADWENNTWGANITAAILPAQIITYK